MRFPGAKAGVRTQIITDFCFFFACWMSNRKQQFGRKEYFLATKTLTKSVMFFLSKKCNQNQPYISASDIIFSVLIFRLFRFLAFFGFNVLKIGCTQKTTDFFDSVSIFGCDTSFELTTDGLQQFQQLYGLIWEDFRRILVFIGPELNG